MTSAGGNSFLGNRGPYDATLDVQNLGTAMLKAESNWWGDVDPADQTSGSVDASPWLAAAPQPANLPEPPANLQRTDVKP